MTDGSGADASGLDAPGFVDPDALASAWAQMPSMLIAMEGAELRIVAMNEAGRDVAGSFLKLGGTVSDVRAGLAGSQIAGILTEVYRTGVAYSARGWRIPFPDDTGEVRERVIDFTYSPWYGPDGNIRGILGSAVDVTRADQARAEAEAQSARWEQQYESSRVALAELQAALLPAEVPVLPGLQVGARYLLSEAETSAGGDWFDVIPLPDGRVALIIGDVVGHGIAASATMGQLRTILSDRLADGQPVGAALAALDRAAGRIPGAAAATVCLAVLDPGTGTMEYCTAGHPPPLVLGDGWRYLPTTGAGPLRSGTGFTTAAAQLGPGELVLLYSDGLVERPDRTAERSTVEIGEVAADALAGRPLLAGAPAHAADRVCQQSLELLTRITGYTDDITVLAARRIDAPAPLTVGVPAADPAAVASLAAELERWLAAVDAGPADQVALRHAVVELVSNSVEHAYHEAPPGAITLRADLDPGGQVTVTVADHGTWQDPTHSVDAARAAGDPRMRGLGLALTRQVVDQLSVDHTDQGTTARVRRRLRRPAPLLSTAGPGRGPSTPAASAADPLTITQAGDQAGGVCLAVSGPLHLPTAETLRTRLATETRGGSGSLALDLSGLTILASAGVQLLQNASADARQQAADLTVTAAPGSVADHVLTLVAVAHDTTSGDTGTVDWA